MILFAHAEALEPGRQAEPHVEIVKAARRVADAERALDARHGFRRRGAVEADGVGGRDGVGVGVVEIEPLPHPLRDGVFEPDLGAEIRRQPGAVEHVGAGIEIARILHHARQARAEPLDRFLGHRLHDRIGVDAVEALDRMRHGVHAARRGKARRQVERQFGIVDRGRGQRGRVIAADAIVGNADVPPRRHFRAGIGGDDGDVGNFGRRRGGLGQSDRRAAADHDKAVERCAA